MVFICKPIDAFAAAATYDGLQLLTIISICVVLINVSMYGNIFILFSPNKDIGKRHGHCEH